MGDTLVPYCFSSDWLTQFDSPFIDQIYNWFWWPFQSLSQVIPILDYAIYWWNRMLFLHPSSMVLIIHQLISTENSLFDGLLLMSSVTRDFIFTQTLANATKLYSIKLSTCLIGSGLASVSPSWALILLTWLSIGRILIIAFVSTIKLYL